MKNYHVIIMSEDPFDKSEDPHQKYGLSVQAINEEDAKKKGAALFQQQHPSLPIFWVKAYED